jgi:hypothetical protein
MSYYELTTDESLRPRGDEQSAASMSPLLEDFGDEGYRPPDDDFIATHYWIVGGSE